MHLGDRDPAAKPILERARTREIMAEHNVPEKWWKIHPGGSQPPN
jgi:hypothetical protein